jgi:hypothetical protein
MARRALAKVRSILALTCVWPTPGSSYSIGSSTVMMLLRVASSRCSAAYSVVVLPEPVGPVTRMMPCGWAISRSKRLQRVALHAHGFQAELAFALVQQAQHGALAVGAGQVLTRTSMARVPRRRLMRPSCGRRFSECPARP